MKKFLHSLLSLALFIGPCTLSHAGAVNPPSPWNRSGSNINYTAGNVAIGSTTPSKKLDVTGSIKASTSFIGSGSGIYQVPFLYNVAYHALGDSITTGTGASTPSTTAYVPLINTDIGGSVLTNEGVSGALSCDISDAQAFTTDNPGNTKNPIYTVLAGTNDANTKGTGAYEINFNYCHSAMISWLGIPSTYKVFGQAATATGTWTNDAAFGGTIIKKSNTNGDTLSFSLTTYGGPAYLWWRMADSIPGTFTYSVDGGSQSSTLRTAPVTAIATQNGGTTGEGFVRISGLTAGTHTILITVTSATNASNVVAIIGVGTPSPYSYYGQPTVFVGGILKQQNDANSTTTSTYNSDVLSNINVLQNDGLNVYFVNVRNYVNSTTDMNDALHPNDTGHGHLRDAFESVMQFTTPSKWQGATNIYYTAGNVGIGTINPGAPLEITGSSANSMLRLVNTGSTGYSQIHYKNNTGQLWQVGVGGHSESAFAVPDKYFFFDSTGNKMRMAIDTSGNVSIGTTRANSLLSVASNISIGTAYATTAAPSNGLIVQGNMGIGSTNPGTVLDVVGTVRATAFTGIVFSAPVSKTVGTIYQAATDGFVTAYCSSDAGGNVTLNCITDSSATPSTVLDQCGETNVVTTNKCNCAMPVQKNNYYQVTQVNCSASPTEYFTPLGA